MEAAVANLHVPGDKVLPVVAGKFGERWVDIATAYCLTPVPLCKEYGEAASADEILGALRKNPGIKSILIQGCETSTATAHDLECISQTVRAEFPEILIIVDAITAVGSQPVEPDAWDLDVVICSSQKAFGVPPGLSFMSLSSRALKVLDSNSSAGRFYFDLRKELTNQRTGSTACTPAISLVVALREATTQVLEEGIDAIVSEARLMARSTRSGLEAAGFRLLSAAPANAATAAFPPSGVGADDLRMQLEQEFGIKVAGGQGKLKDRIIRIAHLGYFDRLDVITVLSAIEMCLFKRGVAVGPGKGVTAALNEMKDALEGRD
jgi:aspartate aminotransferase-like enzyme